MDVGKKSDLEIKTSVSSVLDESTESVVMKALVGNDPVAQRSNLWSVESRNSSKFSQAGALVPTLYPSLLVRTWQLSNILRPLTDTMITNIVDGGWRVEQIIDPDTEDGRNAIRSSIVLQREAEAEAEGEDGPDPTGPQEFEIDERIEQLREELWRQEAKLKAFIRSCNPKQDFLDLLKDVVNDREIVGWGVLEVRRDSKGVPARIATDKSRTFRALPMGDPIETYTRQWQSAVTFGYVKDWVRYRRFVQLAPFSGAVRYFKEYGDPRVMSWKSGRFYKDEEALAGAEKSPPATELIWIPQVNPEIGVYGLPKWAGQINSAVGSYKMELVNVLYFRDKSIPPMAILVSGGKLAEGVQDQIEHKIKNLIRGEDKFHDVITIQAEPATGASSVFQNQAQGQVKVEFVPLTEAFFKEQLFGEYDKQNRDKIRASFRIPRILIGDTEKDNRATVDAALRYADAQVFAPERAIIERAMNRTFVLDIGVSLWKIRLKPPFQVDPKQVMESVAKLSEAVISPAEGRAVLNQWIGIELDRNDEEWTTVPLRQFLAMISERASGKPAGLPEGKELNPGEQALNQRLMDALMQ